MLTSIKLINITQLVFTFDEQLIYNVIPNYYYVHLLDFVQMHVGI